MAVKDYWEENNIPKPLQIIVCAACRIDTNGEGEDIILCSARHWDNVMRIQARAMGYLDHAPAAEQGFIDQFGGFLSRERALTIVKRNGQKFDARRNGSKLDLYSEGLY